MLAKRFCKFNNFNCFFHVFSCSSSIFVVFHTDFDKKYGFLTKFVSVRFRDMSGISWVQTDWGQGCTGCMQLDSRISWIPPNFLRIFPDMSPEFIRHVFEFLQSCVLWPPGSLAPGGFLGGSPQILEVLGTFKCSVDAGRFVRSVPIHQWEPVQRYIKTRNH